MTNKVYIFDSHPVQYKAPVYQAMEAISPGMFEVIYATDASVRSGNVDKEFGTEVVWDTPLLDGYQYRVLENERGTPLSGSKSLTGRGLFSLLRKERPKAVILTQSYYRYDHAAYVSALFLGIPILIRQETQDEMYEQQRSALKSLIRYIMYRAMYAPTRHAFAFGSLNFDHLVKHGVRKEKITFARFSVKNAVKNWSEQQKLSTAAGLRQKYGIQPKKTVIGFYGKLIHKKNPDLIYDALQFIPSHVQQNLHILIVGSGELEQDLRQRAANAESTFGLKTSFCGFVNQTALPHYYVATDMVVLPSRNMGEAWGLVINEALHCGCAAVVSSAAGCSREFGDMERVRVIDVEDAKGLAKAIADLSLFGKNYDWARKKMTAYSTESAAESLVAEMKKYVA